MKDILDSIINKNLVDSDDSEFESTLYELIQYYRRTERHRYSDISRYIFGLEDSELDVLQANLLLLTDYTIRIGDSNLEQNLKKLIDHTDLAQFQKKYIEDQIKEKDRLIRGLYGSTNAIIHKLSQKIKEVESLEKEITRDYNKVISDMDNHKSRIYTQFITILGIFTAIIFGVFGGIEILGNVFENIGSVEVSVLLIFSSLVIGAILTIVYMLLIGIANLTGKSISSCGCKRNSNCQHSIFHRHPIYFVGTLTSFYLFLMGLIAYGYNIKSLKGLSILDRLMDKGSGVFILSLIVLVILLTLFISLDRILHKRKN